MASCPSTASTRLNTNSGPISALHARASCMLRLISTGIGSYPGWPGRTKRCRLDEGVLLSGGAFGVIFRVEYDGLFHAVSRFRRVPG